LTEGLLRRAALASFENAGNLFEGATLLVKNGKAPAATALAIIGEEEFAKAVVYTIAAAIPEERRTLADRLGDLREHNVKHILTGMADGAQIVNSESWAVARQEGGQSPSFEERLTDMFETLAKWGINELITPRKKARAYYEEIRKHVGLGKPRKGPGLHLSVTDPSQLKEAALYVDVAPDGHLSTPDRVGDRAMSQILGLKYFLDQFCALPQVLVDDERWLQFADRLCRTRLQ